MRIKSLAYTRLQRLSVALDTRPKPTAAHAGVIVAINKVQSIDQDAIADLHPNDRQKLATELRGLATAARRLASSMQAIDNPQPAPLACSGSAA